MKLNLRIIATYFALATLYIPFQALADVDSVKVKVFGFEQDKLKRLSAIREVSESPNRTFDIRLSEITYFKSSPSLVEGYQITIRVLNASPKEYPPENYFITGLKYSPIGRVSTFEFNSKGLPQLCVANGTHHMVAPISKSNNSPPPMLALSAPAKEGMALLFGRAYQNVMVKTDDTKQRFASEIQNEVFALGRDIYFSQHGTKPVTIPFSCSTKQTQ